MEEHLKDHHKPLEADMTIKGNISITTALIGGASMVIASAFAAWATVTGSVSEVRTEVSVIQERENNHYAEVKERLDEMNQILKAAPWAKETINKSIKP